MQPESRERCYIPGRGDLRKKPPELRRKWTIGEIQEGHHEVLRLVVLGYKDTEISKIVGMTPDHIGCIRRSPIAQDKIEIMRGARDADTVDLIKEIQDLAPKALDTLRGVMDSTDPEIKVSQKIKVAESILDRAGFAPKKNIRAEHVHAHLTSDEITAIKMRARTVSGGSGGNGSNGDRPRQLELESEDIIDVDPS